MGGTGIATRDPVFLNNLNPAAYTSLQSGTQIAEFGLFVESDHISDKDESTTATTGNITNLDFWLRFSKRWAGSVGVAPFSSVDYNIASTKPIATNTSMVYSGTGGVTQFYFGNGVQLTKNLSLGVTAAFLHGSINRKETVSSGLALGTEVNKVTAVNKGKFDLGFQYQFFMGANNSLTVGGTYANTVNLNASSELTIFQQTDTLASSKTKLNNYSLPQKFGSGIAFQTNRSTVSADLSYQPWSKATLESGLKLRDSRRASFGYQYRGGGTGESFLSGIILRAGAYVQENPLVLQNVKFNDWGVTMGLGLPVSNGRNAINLSYSFNQTGTLEKNLIHQQSHIFALDITFRDLWGIKRKFD